MGSLWNRSGMIERQDDDIRAAGAKAYFFQGLTTTAFTVYADAAEGTAHTNPVLADANGRWPDVFVPYITGYDVLVTTEEGVQLSYTQNIPNPDPIDLSVTIPAANQVQTGMIHAELVNTTKAGYVRLNGRTIGNAVSAATERANADTSDLFVYLWNNLTDAIAPVSGGRSGSALSDFGLNKTITLPNCRGTALIGLDDMGTVAGGNFSATTFGAGNATTAGSWCGNNSGQLSIANIPAHSHTGSTSTDGSHIHTYSGATTGQSVNHSHNVSVTFSGSTGGQSADHTHSYTQSNNLNVTVQGGTPSGVNSGVTTQQTGGTSQDHTHTFSMSNVFTTDGPNADHTHNYSGNTTASGLHSHTFTTSTIGSGTPFDNLPYVRLVTWFIKL